MVRTEGCGDAGGRCGANGRSDPATGGGRPTADGGPTDGLRHKGCLVWNRTLVLMVSLAEKPLTGEPDAGNPPVRFGGRDGANPAIPTPIKPPPAGELLAHQMLQNHLVERRVVEVGDELFGGLLVERASLPHQPLERAPAVDQMRQPVLHFGRAERVHVEADVFAVLAVAVALKGADLVEGDAQIDRKST